MSCVARRFTSEDKHFIEAVANVIAGAWGRAAAAAALVAEKEHLAVTLRSIGDGVISTDTDGRVVLVNTVAETLTGWAQAEAVGLPIETILQLVHHETGVPTVSPVMRALAAKGVVGSGDHHRLASRQGAERLVTKTAAPIRHAEGEILGIVLVLRDETEKYRAEAELKRVGTLESMGLFAGGIAHDFNNILTGILANLSLVQLQIPEGHGSQPRLAAAELAAIRARELTHRLLTFAKRGAPAARALCPHLRLRHRPGDPCREPFQRLSPFLHHQAPRERARARDRLLDREEA